MYGGIGVLVPSDGEGVFALSRIAGNRDFSGDSFQGSRKISSG